MSKLYIVGTPIGNIKDITIRASETLAKVSVIACEDTRVTRKLLNALNIKIPKLIAYHDQNERKSAPGIIKLLKQGEKVALVSDAGMPVISDPGFLVIKEAIAAQIPIEVIPGVSAVLTTLALSSFDTHFKFLGFLKPKSGQRQNQLKKLGPGTYIVFVSPHKLLSTLDDITNILGSETKVFLGRELTKKFESHYRGTVKEVKNQVIENVKGEFTLALVVEKKKGKNND